MVKKKYVYTGYRILSGYKLGHAFALIEDMKEHLYFTDRKTFAIGGIYEMDMNEDESGRFKLGGYTGEDFDGSGLVSKWRVVSAENKADYQSKQMEKKKVKLSADIGEMTINELKEKCKTERSFRNTVLFYLVGARLF